MKITNTTLEELTAQAKASPRLRMNLDLRTSPQDSSQRMLNALEPGTVLPIHRHTALQKPLCSSAARCVRTITPLTEPCLKALLLPPALRPTSPLPTASASAFPSANGTTPSAWSPEPYSSNARTAPTPLSGRRMYWGEQVLIPDYSRSVFR